MIGRQESVSCQPPVHFRLPPQHFAVSAVTATPLCSFRA